MFKKAKVLLLALTFSLAASAGPITYTMTSTGTGTLGGVPFTDAVVTVTLVGDTSNVISVVDPTQAPGPLLANPGTATVNVAGLGTATFTDLILIVSTFHELPSLFGGQSVVFFSDAPDPSSLTSGTGILGQGGPEFFGYDLRTSFGPDTGLGGVFSGSHVTPHFPTTMGDMTWAIGQSLGTSTFTAVATPEPGTLLPPGTVFVSLVCGRFRRGRMTRKTY
jgi:hypothetical protein